MTRLSDLLEARLERGSAFVEHFQLQRELSGDPERLGPAAITAQCPLTSRIARSDGRLSVGHLAAAVDAVASLAASTQTLPAWVLTSALTVQVHESPHDGLHFRPHAMPGEPGRIAVGVDVVDWHGRICATSVATFVAARPGSGGRALVVPSSPLSEQEFLPLHRTASGDLRLPRRPWLVNSHGTFHGGALAILAAAAGDFWPPNESADEAQSRTLRIRYLRPVQADEAAAVVTGNDPRRVQIRGAGTTEVSVVAVMP